MKIKGSLLAFFMSLSLYNLYAVGINLPAKESKLTRVQPIFIHKLQACVDADGTETNVEGLIFIFEITKVQNNDKIITFEELRDFAIDGVSYAELTKKDLGFELEPESEFDEASDYIKKYPSLKPLIKNENKSVILQTAIYGSTLPEKGHVAVTVQIGWASLNEKKEVSDSKVEDFFFEFELESLASENTTSKKETTKSSSSEITEKEKKELLALINKFKKDQDFSVENLKNYSPIIYFATQNELVQIKIDSKAFPEELAENEYAPVFLLAFICGNLEKQLKTGNYTNSFEEGRKLQLQKYKEIKKQNKEINIPFFEK